MLNTRVAKVMIASPSDVIIERRIIRDVIDEWNVVHAEPMGLFLTPVSGDTHAAPAMGDRAQALVNKHVLADCDLLIAVFWHRIGTPTGTAQSGTVEEIEEHIAKGKPAMIYFSRAPAPPDDIDPEQYAELKTFRAAYSERGYVQFFESPEEFRARVSMQLPLTLLREFALANDAGPAPTLNAVLSASEPAAIASRLRKEAREILIAASRSGGDLGRIETMQATWIQVGSWNFGDRDDPRQQALWMAGFEQLVREELVSGRGQTPLGNEICRVTALGYEVADLLK